MLSYFDSSSSSTYPMNGSSPNTMFGSFSSSIGPPEDMEISEFIHSPSSISGATESRLHPSVQRQNLLTNPPASLFPTSPNPGSTEPETVSPSMLRLNNTPNLPVISSSSESLPGPYSPFSMDTGSSAMQGTITSVPESLILPSSGQQSRHRSSFKKAHRGSNSGSKWGRKALPDKAPTPQFILPNNGTKRRGEPDSTMSPKSHSKRSKPKSRASSQLQLQDYPSGFASSSHAETDSLPVPSSSTATDAASDQPSSAERSAQDEFLLNSRLSGMKYSQIRKLGNFKEAESTLRGRFRTLVKPKEARVRNPQWQEIDVSTIKHMSPFFSIKSSLSYRALLPSFSVELYVFKNSLSVLGDNQHKLISRLSNRTSFSSKQYPNLQRPPTISLGRQSQTTYSTMVVPTSLVITLVTRGGTTCKKQATSR